MIKRLVLYSIFYTAVECFGFGPCPGTPMPVGDFNLKAYSGQWYEVMHDPNAWFYWNSPQYCVMVEFVRSDSDGLIYDFELKKTEYVNGQVKQTSYNARMDENGNGNAQWFFMLPETNYQILETDYLSYSIVYGCDNWFYGLFHTEQSWLLSRKRSIPDTVKERAVQKLAKSASWYDTKNWAETSQGRDCVYKNKTLTEEEQSDLDIEEEEGKIINDDKDIKVLDDSTYKTEIQSAGYQARSFKKVIQKMPNLRAYGNKKQVQVFWEDKLNAGGSLFQPKYPGTATYSVKLPFTDLYSKQKLNRQKAASTGNHDRGGYYIIKNVQETVDSTTYYDIWLFSHDIAQSEDTILKKYSSFKDRYVESTTSTLKTFCCFNEGSGAEVSDFKQHVNGLARIISYTRKGTTNKGLYILEGEVTKGAPNGFVRYMTAEKKDMFFGHMGETFNAYYKSLYFKSRGLNWMGTNEYGSTKAYNEKPDKTSKFKNFKREDISVNSLT